MKRFIFRLSLFFIFLFFFVSFFGSKNSAEACSYNTSLVCCVNSSGYPGTRTCTIPNPSQPGGYSYTTCTPCNTTGGGSGWACSGGQCIYEGYSCVNNSCVNRGSLGTETLGQCQASCGVATCTSSNCQVFCDSNCNEYSAYCASSTSCQSTGTLIASNTGACNGVVAGVTCPKTATPPPCVVGIGTTNASCGDNQTACQCNGSSICATQGYYCSSGSCKKGWAGGSSCPISSCPVGSICNPTPPPPPPSGCTNNSQCSGNPTNCICNIATGACVASATCSQAYSCSGSSCVFAGYGQGSWTDASCGGTCGTPPPPPPPPSNSYSCIGSSCVFVGAGAGSYPDSTCGGACSAPPPPPPTIYAISGNVYVDTNGNGVKDAGEGNYTTGTTVGLSTGASTTTDTSGNYTFSSLSTGSYTVTLTVPSGYNSTTTNPVTNVSVGPNQTVNFGIQQGAPTCSGGLTASPTTVNTTAPNNTSTLTVSGCPASGVTYTWPLPDCGSVTNVNASSTTYTAPAATTTTVCHPSVQVCNLGGGTCTGYGTSVTVTPVYTVSGNVFVDVNKNQLKDAGEVNYSAGITITSTGGSVTYPATGAFQVGSLPAGTYTISYTSLPANWKMTIPPGTPPQFTVIVGAGCSVGSSNSATCDANGNITNLNFGITNSIPWCQFAGSDAGGSGGFVCNGGGGGGGGSRCIYDIDCSGGLACNTTGSICTCQTGTRPGTCTIGGGGAGGGGTGGAGGSGNTCTYDIDCQITLACNTSGSSCTCASGPRPGTCTTGTGGAGGGGGTGGGGSGSTCTYDIDCLGGLACNTSGSSCTCASGPRPGTCTTGTGGAGAGGTGGTGGGGAPCVYDIDCNNNLACNTSGGTCTCASGPRPGTCTSGKGGAGGGGGTGGGIGGTGGSTGGTSGGTTGGGGTGGTGGGTGGFNDPIPSTALPICGGPYASIPGGTSTVPGLIFTGNGSAYFGQGSASLNNWLVGGTNYPETFGPVSQGGLVKTSYSYLQSVAKQAGITPVDLTSDASFCSFGGLANCKLSPTLPHGIYVANGNLTLKGNGTPPSYTFPANQNYIILVNGNLSIQTRLYVPVGSTALFSASGNILVDASVGEQNYQSGTTDIEGIFSADQSFVVQGIGDCTVGPDLKLNVAGSIITNAALNGGTFINQRDLCQNNLYCPVFTVQSRPDFILNTPSFLKKNNYTWQELAP